MAGVEDMIEFARASAQKALADPGTHPLEMVSLSIALGLIAIKRDGVQEVRSQYQALLPHAGMASPGSGMLLDRLLGLLAGTMGELDRAAEHFDDALAFARKGGYRPELAWTCRDYADLLLSRNAPGDSERAAALLDEALALAQEMGMRPLVERVQARRGT
jgi:tetratricopeptide (TPR) repeat protein